MHGNVVRIIAILVGIANAMALLLLPTFSTLVGIGIAAGFVVVLSLGIFEAFFWRFRPWPTRALLWLLVLTGLGGISVIEWPFGRTLLSLYLAVAISLVLDLSELSLQDVKLALHEKARRRLHGMLWVFVVFLGSMNTFAFGMFFPQAPFWILHLLLSVLLGGAAFAVWRLYVGMNHRHGVLWAVIVALLAYEMVWVLHWLPYGFFVLGFILTWLWYIAMLLIRFHLGPRGVVWQKQTKFLLVNLGCMILFFVYFIRWI